MKKFTILLVIGLLLCAISTATAGLIGVDLSNRFPDIQFDTIGQIVYNAGTDAFVVTAEDRTITLSSSGPVIVLTNAPGLLTTFSMNLTVNSSGNLVGTGTMEEKLMIGSFTIGDHTFSAATAPLIILQGTVTQFGFFKNPSNPALSNFDYIIDNVSGALVTAGIWPNMPIGIVMSPEGSNGWDGTFGVDFTITKAKGDKAPIPEPATMLLLGSGLIGLAGFARKRFKK